MAEKTIQCTAPDCPVSDTPDHMWLPEARALQAANKGMKVVLLCTLPKFAVCRHHARLLRKKIGIKVYRFTDTVEGMIRMLEVKERQRRANEAFMDFARRFDPNKQPERQIRRRAA